MPGGTLIVEGNYDVDVALQAAKGCTPTLKLEESVLDKGKNVDVYLQLGTKKKLTLEISDADECNNGFVAILNVEPTYEGGNPVRYTVIGTPLSVSFDRLVAALTCPDFELGNLQKDVAWSVLRAAVGTNPQNICSVDKNPFNGSDGYTWAVAPDQTALTYVAKKNGTPTDTDYDFKIIFPVDNDGKSEPRVWVKDADSYQSKDAIKDLADSIIKQRQYANYCINFNGRDYYENCEAYSESIVGDIPTMVASYSTGCIAGTIGCAVALTSLSAGTLSGIGLKDAAASAITCTITPIITAITWKFTSATETSTKYWISETPLAFGGLLPSRLALSATATRLSAKRMATLEKELEMLKNVKTVLNQGAVSEVGAGIKNYSNSLYALVQKASEVGAEDLMDEPLYKVLGYENAKNAAEALAGKGAAPEKLVEFLNDTKLGQYKGPNASDDFAKAFMQAVKESRADPDTVARNLANRYDEVTKVVEERLKPRLSLKQQILCGAVGAATGTLAYYKWAAHTRATGLRYNKLIVTADAPLHDVVGINTTGTSTLHNNGVIEVTPQ